MSPVCREAGCRNEPAQRGLCAAHVELAAYRAKDARRARARERNRHLEMPEQIARLRRQLPALSRHMANIGDIGDLASLIELQNGVGELITTGAVRLHDDCGYSWTDIGDALGVSRQAARQRFADKAGLSANRRTELRQAS